VRKKTQTKKKKKTKHQSTSNLTIPRKIAFEMQIFVRQESNNLANNTPKWNKHTRKTTMAFYIIFFFFSTSFFCIQSEYFHFSYDNSIANHEKIIISNL
jgi:hypothetical protein